MTCEAAAKCRRGVIPVLILVLLIALRDELWLFSGSPKNVDRTVDMEERYGSNNGGTGTSNDEDSDSDSDSDSDHDPDEITLVTHVSASPSRSMLPALLEQIRRWGDDGPVSVGVDAPTEAERDSLRRFVRANEIELRRTELHVLTDETADDEGEDGSYDSNRSRGDGTTAATTASAATDDWDYPQNALLDLAIDRANTDLVLILDPDVVTPRNGHRTLRDIVARSNSRIRRLLRDERTLMALPAFQPGVGACLAPPSSSLPSSPGSSSTATALVPDTKAEAVTMLRDGTLIGLDMEPHEQHGIDGHGPVDYGRWLRNDTDPFYPVKYKLLFEPYVLASRRCRRRLREGGGEVRRLPRHGRAAFRSYGRDRYSWFLEAHHAGFRFAVLRDLYVVRIDRPFSFGRQLRLPTSNDIVAKEQFSKHMVDQYGAKIWLISWASLTDQAAKQLFLSEEKRNALMRRTFWGCKLSAAARKTAGQEMPHEKQERHQQNGGLFKSPAADRANAFLWSDLEEASGAVGVLLHVVHDEYYVSGRDYLAASLTHASMRAPNPMFDIGPAIWRIGPQKFWPGFRPKPIVGVAVGSKFSLNAAHLDTNAIGGAERPGTDLRDAVHCMAHYPIDAWSDNRNQSLANIVGTSCVLDAVTDPLCLDASNASSCLVNIEEECMCNFKSVPGHEYSNHLGVASKRGRNPNLNQCWYPDTKRAVRYLFSASNSIFLQKEKVFGKGSEDKFYWGWTECSTPSLDAGLSDAIVVKMPTVHDQVNHARQGVVTLSGLDDKTSSQLSKELLMLHRAGYGHLPVIILQETKGMTDEGECKRLWGGKMCDSGYRKEFFAEVNVFPDGSCLGHVRKGGDVYYYPVGVDGTRPCDDSGIVRTEFVHDVT